ncbi:hypothetical protein ELI13_37040 [Rhizobium ruizarguesonis]|uniref:Uncharacterized protein n=1 Tax=Rhizobium ruizarguesonis TaxID=2081791 RepID=A0ABY1WXF1_9HYPH|nr:hypothetical protein [Rhizobium ruizarguesonis]TAU17087.1 hypothetical protein ELI48_30475 [Rhizobium ruizarguesonis]TAU57474.1 hypothetical protein ELI45_35265 [Rhizobium ruizarguesonis]TAU59018.1 hypothetical protein ELI46_38740 [Rhizobium ruizarguesonis]TAV03486.1 hypothetical protein ELI34_27980 [Rhizobium ruizarguesonis]TAV19818.1 hypothetical protein ELI35_35140 [Rhizobium ruizarguesonis]
MARHPGAVSLSAAMMALSAAAVALLVAMAAVAAVVVAVAVVRSINGRRRMKATEGALRMI